MFPPTKHLKTVGYRRMLRTQSVYMLSHFGQAPHYAYPDVQHNDAALNSYTKKRLLRFVEDIATLKRENR